MKTEHWRKFLESLEGEKGLPQDYRLLTPGVDTYKYGDEWLHGDFTWCAVSSASIGKLVDKNFNPIVRRAESRQIPDLKEKVKAFVLDAMNVEDDYAKECLRTAPEASPHAKLKVCDAFRALCAPDKGQEVTT